MLKLITITSAALLMASCATMSTPLNTTATPTQTTTMNTASGLVTKQSPRSVAATADKLESLLRAKGMTIFARVDHQQNAAGVNMTLRPTQVLIFGNPKVGTPLMQCAPSVAIDLPQKMLIHEDAAGRVWLSYNDPAYLKDRHNMTGCDSGLDKVASALAAISTAATAP